MLSWGLNIFLDCDLQGTGNARKIKKRKIRKYFENFIILAQDKLNLTLCYYLNIWKVVIKYLMFEYNDELQ